MFSYRFAFISTLSPLRSRHNLNGACRAQLPCGAWDAAGTQPRRPVRRAGPVLEGRSLGCAPQEDGKGPRSGAQV